MENTISTLNDEIGAKKLQIDELDISYAEKKEKYENDIASKEKQLADIEAQIVNKGEIKASVFESLKLLDAEVAEKTETLVTLKGDIENAQEDFDNITKECDQTRKQSAQIKIEGENVLADAHNKESEVKKREDDIVSREDAVSEKEKTIETRLDNLANKETNISVRESQLATREASVVEAQQNVQRGEQENNAVQMKAREALSEAERIRSKERSEFDAYVEAENKKLEDRKKVISDKETELSDALILVDKRDKESLLREEETKINDRKVRIKMKGLELDSQEV